MKINLDQLILSFQNDELYFTEEVKNFADCRETSREIIQVIFKYRKTECGRQRVWENPTEREAKMIISYAWKITDDDELYWGGTITKN